MKAQEAREVRSSTRLKSTHLAVPLDLLGSLSVEDKSNGVLPVLVHLASNVIPSSELVAEPLSLVVEKKTSNSPESLGGQELDLRSRLIRIDETSGMN